MRMSMTNIFKQFVMKAVKQMLAHLLLDTQGLLFFKISLRLSLIVEINISLPQLSFDDSQLHFFKPLFFKLPHLVNSFFEFLAQPSECSMEV